MHKKSFINRRLKEKFNRMSRRYFYLVVAAIVVSVAFNACDKKGSDSSSSSGGGGSSSSDDNKSDPEGTILVAMRNGIGGVSITEVYPDGWQRGDGVNYDAGFCIYYDDNFMGSGVMFASKGKVSGLGAITQIPTNGWTDKTAVIPGYGYVARYERKKYNSTTMQNELVSTHYVRIYVVDYITTTGNEVIGANVKYQSPFNP